MKKKNLNLPIRDRKINSLIGMNLKYFAHIAKDDKEFYSSLGKELTVQSKIILSSIENNDRKNIVESLSNIFDLWSVIAKHYKISKAEIQKVNNETKSKYGLYSDRVILDWVEEKENNDI